MLTVNNYIIKYIYFIKKLYLKNMEYTQFDRYIENTNNKNDSSENFHYKFLKKLSFIHSIMEYVKELL